MITKKQLIRYGMIETQDESFPLKKDITNKDNIFEFGTMSICVTTLTNVPCPCLLLGDGGYVELKNIRTIKDLKTFESYLFNYNPNV